MREKSKIITIEETRFQIGRFLPDVGSFILGKLVGATLDSAPPNFQQPEPPQDVPPPPPDELVRILFFSSSFRGMDFETHRFIQAKALSVCSRLELKNGVECPMPIVSDSGQWAIPEIRDDGPLVVKLELESLIFNLSPFFANGGLNGIIRGSQASKK